MSSKYGNRLHTVHPQPQESVAVQDQKFKFEDQSQLQNQFTEGHTSVVYDATNVRPQFTIFSGEENPRRLLRCGKNDVKCAIRDGSASTSLILQAIRSSLKGKARNSLLTFPTDATPEEILQKLNGIYGNIYPSEKLIQQFYEAKQKEGETVANYGMRLENLIQTCIDMGKFNSESRNEMLRTKLWSGLSDIDLRNASRYKYDTIGDFEELRWKLRIIEVDLRTSASTSGTATGDKKQSQISQIGISDTDSSLNTIFNKLVDMDKRITEVEKEVKRSRGNCRPLTQNEPNAQLGPRSYTNTENRGRNFRSYGTGRFSNIPQRGNYYRGYRQYRHTNGDLNG